VDRYDSSGHTQRIHRAQLHSTELKKQQLFYLCIESLLLVKGSTALMFTLSLTHMQTLTKSTPSASLGGSVRTLTIDTRTTDVCDTTLKNLLTAAMQLKLVHY
jgi:hypothetical protein